TRGSNDQYSTKDGNQKALKDALPAFDRGNDMANVHLLTPCRLTCLSGVRLQRTFQPRRYIARMCPTGRLTDEVRPGAHLRLTAPGMRRRRLSAALATSASSVELP